MWRYAAYNKHLMCLEVSEAQIKTTTWRAAYVIIVFGGSILIAFISPLLAMLSWLLLLFSRRLINRHFDRLSGGYPAGS